MALSANTVLEVRLTGDDTNGGGFVTGAAGTDRSQQDAAFATLTVASVVHTTTTQLNVSAGDYTVTAADVGNLFQLTGGTATAGTYQITAADTVNNRWTVDRALGTAGLTCPGKMGGALASPGKAAAIATVAFQTVFIKYNASPYVITTAATNVSGGVPVPVNNTAYIGYNTTRAAYNLDALRPTVQLQAGVTGTAVFMGTNNIYFLHSVILDANNQTGSRCALQSGEYFNVKGMNGVTGGLNQNAANGKAISCEVTGCVAAPLAVGAAYFCSVHDNALTVPTNVGAIGVSPGIFSAYGCISYNNNCDGFGAGGNITNCVAYGNGGQGFDAVNATLSCVNCIAENNTLFGFRTNTAAVSLINCASFNNTSGRFGNSASGKLWGDINPAIGSGSFFTNAALLDFTLNNTAGAGALLRAAGFPTSAYPHNGSLSFHDIGALQHLDAGGAVGGLLVNPGMRGGMI